MPPKTPAQSETNSEALGNYLLATPQDWYPPDPKSPTPDLGYALHTASSYGDPATESNVLQLQGHPLMANLVQALSGLSGIKRKSGK